MFASANRGENDPPWRLGDFMGLTDGPLAPDPAQRHKPKGASAATRPAASLQDYLLGLGKEKPK